jgi:excisionase family DNA binding protein
MSALAIERPAIEDRVRVAAEESEQPLIAQVEQFLSDQRTKSAALIGPDGERITLPASLYEILRRTVHMLAQGEAVAIAPAHKLLTTNEAADLLNVSRPYLMQLLDRGDIPFTMIGTHHRITFGDAMEYKQRRDAKRRAGLARLAQMTEELGLYDR